MSSTISSPRFDAAQVKAAITLFGVFLFALGVRALGFENVFTDEGVVFAPADATYHMRRAFYTFANFPELLLRDPYLNFPGGVNVPWPPLFDFVVGGVARLFAEDQAGFERVAAWASSVFGALCVIPVYFIARQVTSRGTALFAGILFSLFPMCVKYGRVGNPDHHTAVALVGACMLLLCTYLARPDISDRRIMLLTPALFFVRLAMFLIWHGNLLYMVMFEGTLLLIAVSTKRGSITRAQALSAIFSAVFLSPVVEEFLPVPIGGVYSSISLSRLHVLAMVGTSFVAFAHWGLNKRNPESQVAARIFVIALASAAFLAALLAIPSTREGLMPALQFLTMKDGAGLDTLEQLPLFAIFGRDPINSPLQPWAYFAYLIPLAPFAFPLFVRDPKQRPSAWVLTSWCAGFAFLAIVQRRYGNDLAPSAAVAFALALVAIPRFAVERVFPASRTSQLVAGTCTLLIAIGLLSPALETYELPRLQSGFAALRGEKPHPPIGLDLIARNISHFARHVRAATPETDGFLNQRRNPEYGVIAHANLGHLLHYHARRATATDPMWSHIGPDNWAKSIAFYRAKDETRAIAIANLLSGRFVVTANTDPPGTIAGQLHAFDGRAGKKRARLERFRLLVESEPGRVGFGILYDKQPGKADKQNDTAYKLFEIVQGAILEVEGSPGERVAAHLTLEGPSGRRFVYVAAGNAGPDGVARIRVPYSTGSSTPVHATGPYRITSGFELAKVDVDESDVRDGTAISVQLGL